MDERQLQILHELGALGSLGAVAESLHITPSAVSQQLRLLQRSVAVPLTRKRGRTLALTDAGQELARAGSDVTAALARAREVARDLAREPHGAVTVSAFTSAALSFFPALLRQLPAGGPVDVHLTDEDVAQDDFPRLASRVDVVIAHRLDHTAEWPATVLATPLLHEPLDVAMPETHHLARQKTVSPRDVARERWIATHEGFPVIATVHAIAATAGRPVDIVHRVNEFSIAVEMIKAGGGVALIPRWTTPRPAGVALRPLRGMPARRHIDALHRADRTVRPGVRHVLDCLRDTASHIRAGTPPADGRSASV